MDDEFREFAVLLFGGSNQRGERFIRRGKIVIKRSSVVAVRNDYGFVDAVVIILNGGVQETIIADLDSVRHWLTGRDAPVTLDAFRRKKSETIAAPSD
jgi:hypothetical protein